MADNASDNVIPFDKYITSEQAIALAMKRLGWSREKAIAELTSAVFRGELGLILRANNSALFTADVVPMKE